MTNRSFLEQCLLLLFSLGLFAPVCAQSPAGVPNPTFWFENTIEPNAMLQGKIAPAIDLAHELAHAYDAIHGLMNFDKIEVFGVPGVKEIEKNEFQAVYRENLIRQELNMPLRTHYITNETTDGTFIKGLGPNMLDSSGKPKRPSWY